MCLTQGNPELFHSSWLACGLVNGLKVSSHCVENQKDNNGVKRLRGRAD
jgi:hypothetical protein